MDQGAEADSKEKEEEEVGEEEWEGAEEAAEVAAEGLVEELVEGLLVLVEEEGTKEVVLVEAFKVEEGGLQGLALARGEDSLSLRGEETEAERHRSARWTARQQTGRVEKMVGTKDPREIFPV